MSAMRTAGRHARTVAAAVVVALGAFVSSPGMAAAPPAVDCVALPLGAPMPCEAARPTDQRLGMDKRRQVMAATAYQTLMVAGAIGGVVAIGAFSGGLHGAVLAGTAAFAAYLFMP